MIVRLTQSKWAGQGEARGKEWAVVFHGEMKRGGAILWHTAHAGKSRRCRLRYGEEADKHHDSPSHQEKGTHARTYPGRDGRPLRNMDIGLSHHVADVSRRVEHGCVIRACESGGCESKIETLHTLAAECDFFFR